MAVSIRVLASIALLVSCAAASTFEDTVQPFLTKHCSSCHGEQLQMADLRLDLFADESEALRHPGVWDDVLRMTRSGKMPPPGSDPPLPAELASLAA